jgi:hypothetical protein
MPRLAILCAVLVAASIGLVGCDQAPELTGIQVIPNGASLTTVGETVQFKAIGTFQRANHPSTTSDITTQVLWASSEVGVTTITSSGLATAVSDGNSTITASMGGTVGAAPLGVSPLAHPDLSSIAIIPGTTQQTVSNVGESTQFIAIGTFTTAPMTLDITDQVTWQSSDVSVATINSAGFAIGAATGTTTITAIGTSTGGAAITGTSILNVVAGSGGVTLPLLSVYEVGLGKGTVTSNPAGISCAAASPAGCTGNFVLGSATVLTATPAAGSTFGGWSSNCVANSATTCTAVMNNNEPVGAIFN